MNKNTIGKTDFLFWGKRTYIHSSHIFPDFVNKLDKSKYGPAIRLVTDFRSLVTTNGEYMILEDDVLASDYPVVIQAFYNDRLIRFGLRVGGKPVETYMADDEDELIAKCIIKSQQQKGRIDIYDSDRLIGVLVALVKRIHLTCLPVHGFSLWLVGRLDVDMIILKNQAGEPLSAAMVQNMGDSMTRSKAWLGDQSFAQVNFIRRKISA